MICLYNPNHTRHDPPFEVFNGDHDTAQEVPERALHIHDAIRAVGYTIDTNFETVPYPLLKRVHDKEYLHYLKESLNRIPKNRYEYPSVRPYVTVRHSKKKMVNPIALRGQYVFDTYTPLLRHTYETSVESASLAYTAATRVLNNPNEIYYALCRPPGHHAEHDQAGGYCYINNAAVAAQHLSKYGKVAVLDIDFHHGNGTQHIFYDRSDVLTISIHADPQWKFPYYSGFKDEVGSGKGLGYNHNYPLPEGTTDGVYHATLIKGLEKISSFKPSFLVVSYGGDTHVSDPIGGFKLSTKYFTLAGSAIRSVGVPTVIVQEGGYNNKHLGTNVAAFLKGFV